MIAQTPLLKQYFALKAERPEVLIAMRVGDFYEFYGEDAEIASRAAEISLTGREDGSNGRIPMAGVPYHAIERYLAKLVAAGLKVALCDQLEDPKQAKGLVKRGITRVLTPGTLMEDTMLPSGKNSFLAALCLQDGKWGLAVLDPSTGEFTVTQLEGPDASEKLLQELARIRPSELLFDEGTENVANVARDGLGSAATSLKAPSAQRSHGALIKQFGVANLNGFGIQDQACAQVAAAMILAYANSSHLALDHVEGISSYSVDEFMRLDLSTRRSLELTANLADGSKKYTLLDVLDATQTPMGGRLLRRWIEQPLLDLNAILERQQAVSKMCDTPSARVELRDGLRKLGDLERLASRASAGLSSPRDLGFLSATLSNIPKLHEPLRKLGVGHIQTLREAMVDHTDLAALLDSALTADLPMAVRDGGVIKPGFDDELDKLRELMRNGKGFIASLEAQELEKTGISTLKVGFNSVFGYYLEVSKTQIAKVPDNYIRKQTTANAERYITAELKEQESLVLGAEEKALALEAELFVRLRGRAAAESTKLLQTARALAQLDAIASLAEVAVAKQFVKPEFVSEDVLEIVGGRHPVVETAAPGFVPNDTDLGANRLVILTGPNMSGKSTYLRQNALICLMAQMGSFVPATSCRLGLCDRIFARIGAKDELALGQSTFMVEMVESANILNHATQRSLVILDEVGRGTSTYDGLAIAWAMVEYLVSIGCKTFFATHYHQLNSLENEFTEISNYRVAVQEKGDLIVWTHKVMPGGTDRSYGVQVAKMAGVPPSVLARATTILQDLEGKGAQPRPSDIKVQRLQLSLFEAEEPEVVRQLRELDINQMSPMEALRTLDTWKQKL